MPRSRLCRACKDFHDVEAAWPAECVSHFGVQAGQTGPSIISDNIVDGSDDDCIALGYNGTGEASKILVSGNYCRARNDLGTSWGRGILVERASDVLIVGNVVDSVKQTGILINNASGTRPTRISVKSNQVRNTCISSGHAIAVYGSDYVTLEDNDVSDPIQGSCIEIADWTRLSIKGGTLSQGRNVFGRGIHADESAGWGGTWVDLQISNVDIRMLGAATDVCIYLNPHSSVQMYYGAITGVSGIQVPVGDYISVATARMSSLWKIGNNVAMLPGLTVSPAASAGVYTIFNNN